MGAQTKDEDFIKHVFVCSTIDTILFFTDRGKVHWLRGYLIPEAGRNAKGKPIVNLLKLEEGERIAAVIPVKQFSDDQFLLMATRSGIIKKTVLSAYSRPRQGGIIGITLREGDSLIEVKLTDGRRDVILSTRNGMSIRFPESEVKAIGRAGIGVVGIRFKERGEECVGCEVVDPDDREQTLITVCENGYGKRTKVSNYRRQHRGGKGVIDIKTRDRNGHVVGIRTVAAEDELILVTRAAMIIRTPVRDIRVIGRNTAGVRLINLADRDKIVDVALVPQTNGNGEVG